MTSQCKTSYKDIVSFLKCRVEEVLQPILPRGRVCALLDFPNHANVGDSAIWVGEKNYLRGIGASLPYTCDRFTYSQEGLAVRLREGTILLSGGGNLGDVWPNYQRFRERVILDFPDKKIIQLPQSIHFKDKANLKRARAAFNSHPDLTILVRDQRSLEVARNEFKAKSVLCPDMAFALGLLDQSMPPDKEIVWLSRTDIESSGHFLPARHAEVDQTDWLEDVPSLIVRANQLLIRQMYLHPRIFRQRMFRQLIFRQVSECFSRTYDPLARQRLLRGCRILNRGKVVVTDRLHGHILSLLMGIPHVVLDNNYGKVRSFYETWTKGCELTVWAQSPEEALKQARALARSGSK